MTRALAAALVTLAAATGLPAAAPAATAEVEAVQESRRIPPRGVVRYRAGPGEANRLAVRTVPGQPDVVELREAAIAITPGVGCASVDATTVRCDGRSGLSPFGFPGAFLGGVIAELGDRADEGTSRIGRDAAGRQPEIELRGGPGNDRLLGSDGASETLRAGAGADDVRGGGDADTVAGGSGRDRVLGGAGDDWVYEDDEGRRPGRDSIDAGPGTDWLLYQRRRGRVAVDLALRRGADGDRVAGIENVGGGGGPDVLRGSAGANELRGQAGNDRVAGRGGADRLFGAEGRDLLSGGSGRDELDLADGLREGPDAQRDRAGCGSGADRVLHAFAADRLLADCERVRVEGEEPDFFVVLVSQPLRAQRGGRVPIRLADPGTGQEEPFRGRVTLSYRGVPLGRPSRAVVLGQGTRTTVHVRLIQAALTRLNAARGLTVQVTLNDATFSTTLRPARLPRTAGGGTPG